MSSDLSVPAPSHSTTSEASCDHQPSRSCLSPKLLPLQRKSLFPAATQVPERQKRGKNSPVTKHTSTPVAKRCPGMLLAANPRCERSPTWRASRLFTPAAAPFIFHSPAPQELPSITPAPFTPLALPGRWLPTRGSASSPSCPLPRAPLGRRCSSFPAGASRGQCELNAATSAFCCLPSPAFGWLQVTASQGALKVLCSNFLLL